jgi:hypothetical protein
MSRMSSLVIDLMEAVETGASFETIARQFDVPVRWVLEAAKMLDDSLDADPGEMDGDAASALASVGWGTDEDYGGGDAF